MAFDFDKFYKLFVRAMRINTIHPDIKRDKKWLRNFICTFTVYTLVYLLIIYNIVLNLKSNDFGQACKYGVLAVIYIVATFQLCIILWKQDYLQDLITLMKKDYIEAESLCFSEQEIMYKYVKKGKHVCNQWLVITICGIGMFPLKNLTLMCYQIAIGEPKLIQLYEFVYPGIIDKYKDNIIVYLMIYAVLMFYGLYSACMFMSFEPLGPIFMLHLCGQLEMLEKKVVDIFEDGEEVEEKLKEIVVKLQYIYSFADKLLLSFRVNYELTLKASTILLPITCYEVIEALHRGEIFLEFITFIVGGTLISSSPCYYSELLMEKGQDLRTAVYSCGWETVFNPEARNTIRMILIRTLRPVAIRSLFRTVCLEALTDLFQQSYAIFNLMNSM